MAGNDRHGVPDREYLRIDLIVQTNVPRTFGSIECEIETRYFCQEFLCVRPRYRQ